MKSKEKKGKVLVKIFLIFLIAVTIFVAVFLYFRKSVYDHIYTATKALVLTKINDCINLSCADYLNKYEYDKFVNLITDDAGNVILMESKSSNISVVSRELGIVCQKNIDESMPKELIFSSGSFFDRILFSSTGEEVIVPLSIIANVCTDIKNVFIATGINQTKHSIYIQVSVDAEVIQPLIGETFKFSTALLIAENLIVGKVPEVFVDSVDGLEYLDLIP